jgi:hypothetical protein
MRMMNTLCKTVLVISSFMLFACSEDLADITVKISDFETNFSVPTTGVHFDGGVYSFVDTTQVDNNMDLNGITGNITKVTFDYLIVTVSSTSAQSATLNNFKLRSATNVNLGTYTDDPNFQFTNSLIIPSARIGEDITISTAEYPWLNDIPKTLADGGNAVFETSGTADLPEGADVRVKIKFSGARVTYNPLK